MKFNRTKNAMKTFIFGIASRIITVLCPFITRTLIIYKLGADYIGLTSLFTSVLTILNVSELGISSAISFCLYKPIAEDDMDTINALMAFMKKVYRFIGLFILGIGLGIMPFLSRLIGGEYPEDINIYILYLIYLLNSSVSYLGYAYKTVLFEAYQEGDVNHKINIFAEVVKYILQIVILVGFSNYYWYAAMLPIVSIMVTIVTEIQSRKKHPQIIPEGQISKETQGIIKKKVIFLGAHSIASKLTTSVDNIVISSALGLVSIAIFGNYQYVYSAVCSVVAIMYQALKPVVGNSYHTDSMEKQYQLFEALRLLAKWICTWCATCLLCLYQPFMKLWLGEEYLLDFITVIVFVLFFYSNVIRQFYTSTYIEVAGLWNKTLARQLIAAAVNLILDVLLVKRWGIFGIVFASFASNTFIAYPMDIVVTYKEVLKSNVKAGIIKEFRDFGQSILICAVSYMVCSMVRVEGVLVILIRMLICIVVHNIIVLCRYRKTYELDFLFQHIKNLIIRK